MDGLISLIIVVFIVLVVVKRSAGRLKAAEAESKKKQSYYSDSTSSLTDSNPGRPFSTAQNTQSVAATVSKPTSSSVTANVSRPVSTPVTATVSRPTSSTVAAQRPQSDIQYYQKKPSDSGIDRKMSKESGNALRDDRSGDWLAKQLADERKALRQVSEMFELKAYHANQCEAEMLKRFHEENCDAEGIDTAKGR